MIPVSGFFVRQNGMKKKFIKYFSREKLDIMLDKLMVMTEKIGRYPKY